MGVVYKFRKEVIDFVLQQKRTGHDLGCRQLATLTSEKFKMQVSKSSINAIIKNANLSNSVGRPLSADPAPKKFQIPLQKKQQLFDEIRKARLDNVNPEQKPLPVKALARPGKALVIEPQRQGFSQAAFLRHVESERARRAQNKGVMREGMGCVFLKAAQWQLSRSSVLGGLLRKHIPEPLPAQFDAFCDTLPCLNLLGASAPGQTSVPTDNIGCLPNHALWHLNGFDQPLSDPEISRWSNIVEAISPSVKFSLEYEKEKRQAFMGIERFELHLGNGTRITTDARLTGLGGENFGAGSSACAEQAMAMLSHCVISNNRPAIFLSSAGRFPSANRLPAGGGKERFPQEAWDMMAAFEGAEGEQLKRAVVFDSAGEQVAEFSSFPRKKRFFMLGVWPWQEEFLLLSKHTKTVEPFYDEVTDNIFYVAAGPAGKAFNVAGIPGEAGNADPRSLLKVGGPLRSITILRSPEETPIMIILTNCADEAPTDIFRGFLRRWPNLDAGPRSLHIQKDTPDVPWQAGQNASVIFQDWGGALNQYCQKYFFNVVAASSDMVPLISSCYALPGYHVPQERALLVSLRIPSGYLHSNALRLAVERVNEAGITDPLGRVLYINIVK